MYEYWKQRLDAQGLRVYAAMERAAQQNSDRADFSGAIPAASISAATEAFLGDHPEFFQYGSEFQVVRRGAPPMGYPQGEETILRFKLLYSPFEIRRIRASMEKLADDFQRRFPAGGEAAERAVAEWIARNVKYNINNTRNQNAASALYFHSAQCSGISRAVKYLCDRIGIECIVVAGTGSGQNGSGPHAWNIVRINGNYYHLDATYLLGANPNASAPLRYLYFNYSDAAMQSTHVWDRASVPVCSDTSYEGAQGGEAQAPVQRTQAPVQRAIPVQRTQAPVQRARRLRPRRSLRSMNLSGF